MTVTAKPRIELDSYDPVEIPAMEASVDEAELDAFMENVARFHPDAIVDKQARVVALDGVVRLSMETTRDGKRYEPLCFDEKEYRLGKSDMPEGFDEQLAGMEAGQTKTISFVAPDPTQPRGGASRQCAYFAQVTVTAIMKLVDPVIDDAWVASNIEGCATVQAMRDKAAKELEEGKASQIGEYERYCAADAVSKRLSQPIPDAVFSAAYEKALDEHASMLEYQGITLEDYLQNAEMDEREFKHRLMSQVRERLRQEVALDAVARHEGLKVSKDDLREYLDRLTDGQHEQTLKSLGEHGGMHAAREGALREKANRLLVERAVRSAG